MSTKEKTYPSPAPNPDTQVFWDAAKEGRFLVKFCNDCGKAHWYPRAVCPLCFSSNTEWRAGSGKGTLYTYSPMRRADPPFVLAYVTLEEGPTMLTNIVDCDPDQLAIGQAVELLFRPSTGDYPIPLFKPAS